MLRPRPVLAALLLLALGAWASATAVLIFLPDEGAPARANAVVVLSGDKGRRLERALELMRRRLAPVLVISAGLDKRQPKANRLCATGRGDGFRVLCFMPHPDSTRGEAQAVARLARRHRWRSVVIVTSRFHVTRARMLFERCLDARVNAVGASYPWTSIPVAVVSEWLKLAYALLVARGC